MICPHCQIPMTDAMIGVTILVYQGPTENQMVRGWTCPCGVRLWRDELVRLPKLGEPVGATR
jgi:hypothetical protein